MRNLSKGTAHPAVTDKPAPSARAGTRLVRKVPVKGPSKSGLGPVTHGFLDPSQRVYQTGGEARNFTYYKAGVPLLTLATEVWERVKFDVERIEWIDHVDNRYFAVPAELALRYGHEYQDRLGTRWGIPRHYALVSDAAGTVFQRPQLPLIPVEF